MSDFAFAPRFYNSKRAASTQSHRSVKKFDNQTVNSCRARGRYLPAANERLDSNRHDPPILPAAMGTKRLERSWSVMIAIMPGTAEKKISNNHSGFGILEQGSSKIPFDEHHAGLDWTVCM